MSQFSQKDELKFDNLVFHLMVNLSKEISVRLYHPLTFTWWNIFSMSPDTAYFSFLNFIKIETKFFNKSGSFNKLSFRETFWYFAVTTLILSSLSGFRAKWCGIQWVMFEVVSDTFSVNFLAWPSFIYPFIVSLCLSINSLFAVNFLSIPSNLFASRFLLYCKFTISSFNNNPI